MVVVVISLKDLSVYQNDILVLSEVNVSLRKRNFTYLIGKTGSGKSIY
jgi:cell division transport system ATP-binding protein